MGKVICFTYRVYDREWHLIYVGSTRDLESEMAEHRRSSWWAPEVAAVQVRGYDDPAAAEADVASAIRASTPG